MPTPFSHNIRLPCDNHTKPHIYAHIITLTAMNQAKYSCYKISVYTYMHGLMFMNGKFVLAAIYIASHVASLE